MFIAKDMIVLSPAADSLLDRTQNTTIIVMEKQ